MTWGDEGGERAVLELELKEMLMDKVFLEKLMDKEC
jgi:hypothetical protein